MLPLKKIYSRLSHQCLPLLLKSLSSAQLIRADMASAHIKTSYTVRYIASLMLLLTLSMPVKAIEWCFTTTCVSQGPNGCAGSSGFTCGYGSPEGVCSALGGTLNSYACSNPDTGVYLGAVSPELDSLDVADPGKNVNITDANPDCGNPVGGNPINFALGIKAQKEIDLASQLDGGLSFIRSYNSYDAGMNIDKGIGYGWMNTYSSHLTIETLNLGTYAYYITAHQSDGRSLNYSITHDSYYGTYASSASKDDENRIEAMVDAQQELIGWRLFKLNGMTEEYNTSGKLLKIINRVGHTQTLQYDIDSDPQTLDIVTGPFGRTLTFTPDNQGRIQTFTDPTNAVYQFAYDSNGNLETVTYPDETPSVSNDNPIRQYHYEDVNFPHALTGITDENGNRYATWNYDTNGRAYTSEHANGVEYISLNFDEVNNSTTVTDAKGHANTYHYMTKNGVTKIDNITGEKGATCGKYQDYIYDVDGNPTHRTDFNGNLVTNSFNPFGMEIRRAEGDAMSGRRVDTDYAYVNFRDLPSQIRVYNGTYSGQLVSQTSISYTALGQLMQTREMNLVTAEQLVTLYTYDPSTQFLESIDGPRTDVNDVTEFEYDPNTGNLYKTINALGHETTITQYDGYGRPERIVDSNGTLTELQYHPRGWLRFRTVGGQVTEYRYDAVGQLEDTLLPNGSSLHNDYDAAQRLTDMTDNLGNTIHYDLDALGNRTKETARDVNGVLRRQFEREYNALNRLILTIGGAGQINRFVYDANGNLTDSFDPREIGSDPASAKLLDPTQTNNMSHSVYDALNRLVYSINGLDATISIDDNITQYDYNAFDNLISVTDAEGLETQYNYNTLADLIQEVSPNTGITDFTYDRAGNRKTQVDARGIQATYTYDVLNRLTSITYPDTTQNISYSYDSCTNGIGRLCQMDDESGSRTYTYDARGNLTNQTTTIDSLNQTTSYAYNGADQLTQITYPSGRVVDYLRNALGQVDSVTTTKDSVTETLASNLSYQPFGPMDNMTYGNNLVKSKTYDLDYRLATLVTASVQNRSYILDNANNITDIIDNIDNNQTQDLGYDELNRLTDATGLYGDIDYGYDAIGNRLNETIDTHPEIYTYDTVSHHLQQTVNGGTHVYTYDANGNTTSNSERDFVYGDNNRLKEAQILGAPLATYTYNGRGERVKKVATDTTYYHYDQGGQLIAETDTTGTTQVEYLYLDGQPLALISMSAGSSSNNDPIEQILDNNSNASYTGDWPTSTSVSGYEGIDYQHHVANGPSPDGIVIDNSDAGFSVTGTWTNSTAINGYVNSDYQHHYSQGPSPDSIAVDSYY